MNIRDAKTLANKLMRQHGLKQQGWVLEFDKAVSRSGMCNYRKRVISLSEPITLLNPKSEVQDTILHEIAHALMPGSGHNMYWRSMAIQIGASGSRCAAPDTKVPPRKWIAYCPNGHTSKTNRRALRSPRSCGRCSRVYNPEYIIKYKLNTEGA